MKIIKNGIVHDGLGNVEIKDIAIEGDLLVSLPENEKNCEIIDATGMHILPGFIDPCCSWGILGSADEIRPSSSDNDEKSAVSTPELDITYAFNGRGISKQQLAATGITTVGVAPTDNNIFGGQMAVFDTKGVNPFKMLIKNHVGMKASVTNDIKNTYGKRGVMPMTKMGIYAILKDELRQAAEYNPEKDKRSEKLAALKQVTDGKMPVFITADSVDDMQYVKEIFEPYKTKLVFVHGYDANESCDFLLDGNCAFITNYVSNGMEPNMFKINYAKLFELHKKGLPMAISCGNQGFSSKDNLLWGAIEFIKATKESESILELLTSQPAKILGIDDMYGSIEIGKKANIVIWSDNPLKTFAASIEHTFLSGEIIYSKGDDIECYI